MSYYSAAASSPPNAGAADAYGASYSSGSTAPTPGSYGGAGSGAVYGGGSMYGSKYGSGGAGAAPSAGAAPPPRSGYVGGPAYGAYGGGGGYGGGGYGGYGGYGAAPYSGRGDDLGRSLQAVDWKTRQLPPFNRNFYKEAPRVAAMSQEEADKIRAEQEIRIVSGQRGFNPVTQFEEGGFPQEIVERLYSAGFKRPSPIQSQSWPIILSGHDYIGIAETGSGKTLAFVLPAVVHIQDQPRLRTNEGPIALILAPTRELVEQIKDECEKFAIRQKTGVAYGGAPKRQQISKLRMGCEIVAACPGRLIDFMESGSVSLERCTYLVLDEADRMLDMGFEPQIRKIVGQIRPDRQVLMFSATWPKEVQGLARDLCKSDPVHVTIGNTDLKASHNVVQHVTVVQSEAEKHERCFELLQRLRQEDPRARTLIFTETKRACDGVMRDLRALGFQVLAIHGDKEQGERRYVLEEFKSGNHPILVATDVASRGLDVKDVRYVVNYDMPGQVEDYVHRIGRTGRAGAKGESFSFLTPDKARLARQLIQVMEEARQEVSPELRELCNRNNPAPSGSSRYGGRGRWGGGGGRGGPSRGYGGGGYGAPSPYAGASAYGAYGAPGAPAAAMAYGASPGAYGAPPAAAPYAAPGSYGTYR